MKHITAVVLLILVTAGLSAEVQYESSSNHIDIHLSNAGELSLENGIYYTSLAFPAKEVSLQVIESEVKIFDNEGSRLTSSNELAAERIELESTQVMRDLIMHRIRIEVEKADKEIVSSLQSAVIRLQAESTVENIQSVSSVFAPLYSKMVDNYETSYLRNLQEMPAKMLIISHEGLDNLSYFTDWKNERGIATEVVYRSDLGNTVSEIKDFIQEQYDTQEHPPDYLLLIGDVNGAYVVPSYYHSAENDVTDHPYTLLDGTDYLPEMIVGRFSIDQSSNLNTIIAKVLNYEKTPSMTDPDWFERMVIVAGNYSDLPPVPSTPVTTSMWLAEKAWDYGYQDVTEIYYWPPEYTSYPGTSEIINAIDNGAGIVTYRGWGNAWGWNYPYFHTENIQQLTNAPYLPIMTSIVCNTGDFANENVDPCFGELWLTAGNTTNPKGGVVFLGPSDLHTKTRYNNSIFAGFYQGLLDEGIHSFGTATLRGKMELYDNFPLNHGPGEYVEFYFYVYNILGDPSLNIWTKTPAAMSCELPEEIALGQNYLDIYVPEIASGMVTARKDGEFMVSEFIRDHSATLFFNAESEGTIHVTVTAVNHLPYFIDLNVVSQAIDPAITAIEPQTEILAGMTAAVDITLTNQGTESAQFNGTIQELTGMAEPTAESFDFGILAPGASASVLFEFEIAPACLNNWELSFELDFIELEKTIKFPLLTTNFILEPIELTVEDANGILEPGETADITVTIANIGTLSATGLTAGITSASTALIINDESAVIGDLPAGASGTAAFSVTAEADGYNGREAGIYLLLEDESGRYYETSCLLTIGEVTNTDPTGPCPGGYYAYDSFDTAYEEAPEYFWTEIDPELGGNGDVILMSDDQSESIALPFEFTFYDAVYDSITVSSNGWISFDTTWQNYFRNWLIPGALGPNAQVAAYWDDLIGPGGGALPLRLCYDYLDEEDIFVIEWANAVSREDNVSPEIFQIVLYDPAVYLTASGNGVIQINYQDVNNPDTDGNYCTVGIENQHQTIGLLYSYADQYPVSATEMQPGLAIKYSTEAPDSFTAEEEDNLMVNLPKLNANYPNPFNPETSFGFSLPQAGQAELAVYNIKGEKVITIMSDFLDSGDYQYTWRGLDESGRNVASGVYFYQLKAGKHTTTKKCVLMK